MGGSSSRPTPPPPPPKPKSKPSTPPTPSPPLCKMINVTFIDIYGLRVIKNVNQDWNLALLAKSLSIDYVDIKEGGNFTFSLDGRVISYSQDKTSNLKSLGFKENSEIYIRHEKKGSGKINVFLIDTNDSKIVFTVNPQCIYKDFCELFKHKTGIPLWLHLVMIKKKTLIYDSVKSCKISELNINSMSEVRWMPRNIGGFLIKVNWEWNNIISKNAYFS